MKYPIPNKINLLLLIIAPSLAVSFLFFCEQAHPLWLKIIYAICFGLVNNTIFSLLHDATHGSLFSNRKWNNWGGRFAASFFPTSFTMQQIFHLGHHRRNRTDEEIFDQYYPTDNVWVKRFVIYSLLLGFYYPSSPLANILFLIFPWMFEIRILRKNSVMKLASFDSMLKGLERKSIPKGVMRLEILFTIAIQFIIIYSLNLSFLTWFLCYYAFNILWSSLQYTDHAWSKRSIREGAWNLKVSPIIEKIYLNYHFHLVHHRYPNVSWIHLPKLVKKEDPSPSFWAIYLKLWKGPTPIKEQDPKLKSEFKKEIYMNANFKLES